MLPFSSPRLPFTSSKSSEGSTLFLPLFTSRFSFILPSLLPCHGLLLLLPISSSPICYTDDTARRLLPLLASSKATEEISTNQSPLLVRQEKSRSSGLRCRGGRPRSTTKKKIVIFYSGLRFFKTARIISIPPPIHSSCIPSVQHNNHHYHHHHCCWLLVVAAATAAAQGRKCPQLSVVASLFGCRLVHA